MKKPKAVWGAYTWQVKVTMFGYIDDWIQDFLGEGIIIHEEDGNSTLMVELPDVSAVYGLVLKLRDSGTKIISMAVKRYDKNY